MTTPSTPEAAAVSTPTLSLFDQALRAAVDPACEQFRQRLSAEWDGGAIDRTFTDPQEAQAWTERLSRKPGATFRALDEQITDEEVRPVMQQPMGKV